ncbi:helix-turn-helix domain-containing protein [Amycolatopsis sp. EV170708-02-1]|uniref:winged helix-turn-helix transcriptional regulator n=1 Tax=Amycolatopsis sp. EV170708-02-1 TaxID=2919322 RepID=UPI001F0C5D00|nr:helix-turn-helix domain-containing protein [Amycolatopsis sp. EV170708-02-1]UMP05174.1 helix-turn-helix transcriptional regulator [Amycolatopsis sp. EV170708-02-1]
MPDDPIPRPGRPVRGSETGRPLMAALDLLGRRWTLRVIWELRQGDVGFRELRRRCEHMSSSVLATRLGELTEARIVETGEEGYRLTRLGERLLDALHPLEKWGLAWEKALRE